MAALASFSVGLQGGVEVSATLYRPETETESTSLYVYAHGAGAGMQHPFIVRTATELAQRGVAVLSFNFPYKEQNRKAPDRPAVLSGCWCDLFGFARTLGYERIAIGGKSMGGRYASMGAADGSLEPAGLVYYGYPLHPAGKPDRLRKEHLGRIRVPQLFMVGTRDKLSELERLHSVTERLPGACVAVFQGGYHSFKVRKKDGVDQESLFARLADRAAQFIRQLGP